MISLPSTVMTHLFLFPVNTVVFIGFSFDLAITAHNGHTEKLCIQYFRQLFTRGYFPREFVKHRENCVCEIECRKRKRKSKRVREEERKGTLQRKYPLPPHWRGRAILDLTSPRRPPTCRPRAAAARAPNMQVDLVVAHRG